MQKLAEVCIKRPVFAAMIILSLVVVGAQSYFKLGVDRFPSIDVPTVYINTMLPGASPEELEASVVQLIEEAVNTVEGIEMVRSMSRQGSATTFISFDLKRNIEDATQDIRDRLATIVRQLPPGADPPFVRKNSSDSDPVITLAISGPRSARELREIAENRVKIELERGNGVGEVAVYGGLKRAINVWVDADRLAAYKIPITQVRQALVRGNTDIPGGNVDAGRREVVLRTMGKIVDPREFNDLIVANINGFPVRIRDIGRAEDGSKEERSVARLNGDPSITVGVIRQTGSNTVAVIEDVKKRLEVVKSQLPADLRVEIIRDQSRYIYNALHEINTHLVLGSILACLVVFLFMRSWRAMVIAGIAIPTSVISTFGMMRALDFTLNSVTMLALVLMVGIVIDDAIVVLENIFRFVEEKKMEPMEAAREATKEIGLAVMATTFSLVVIFLPVGFMSSISGRFLYQFGITAAVAILVSLLVSFTLTPMMSARLLRKEDAHAGGDHHATTSRKGFYRFIDHGYTWLLQLVMRHRLIMTALAVLVVYSSGYFYKQVRQEFVPSNVDEGEFYVNLSAPEGTSLMAMNEALQAVEADLKSMPEIRLMLASVGGGGGGGGGGSMFGSVNNANIYVRLAPHEERTVNFDKFWAALKRGQPMDVFKGNYTARDVMQKIRGKLRKYTHLRPSVRNPESINLGTGPSDFDFSLKGPDLMVLYEKANQMREWAGNNGILDPDVTLKLDKPEWRINVDRTRAADLGVDTTDIANALRLMVGGDDRVSRFYDASTNFDYDVELRLQQGDRNDQQTIERLFVPSTKVGLVRLDNLVDLQRSTAPSRIDRQDRQRVVSVRGSVAPGYGLADRMNAFRAEFANLKLPSTYSYAIGGRGRELERTFSEFILAFMLSVAFMYMILASQFESTIHPITILLSLPISVPFALLSLWATDNTLNLYSALGILVLFGVVKKNSILQIDHTLNLRRQGMERHAAIIQANRDRLRPILMTTLALVAGMLPLALGSGPGAEERRSIAIVVIGGQSLSLLLTLLMTPVAYSIFDDITEAAWWRKLTGLFRRKKAASEEDAPLPDVSESQLKSGD
ncbi:MAG TPA: efflux RND transporter permease subunit [Blastocatellia bacterium]|nr:efflux RND transporter permease subunit [Blastocatellia bacterium]